MLKGVTKFPKLSVRLFYNNEKQIYRRYVHETIITHASNFLVATLVRFEYR